MCALTDGDAHGRRSRLQPSRHIDGVARQEALTGPGRDTEADQSLAGIDADAHLER